MNRYVVAGIIGRGGTATVHLGSRVGPDGAGRTVAIKRLRRELATDRRAMTSLADEARIAAQIVHPNVVPVVDVVTSAEDLFIVMEYVEGASLAALLGAAAQHDDRIPTEITLSLVVGALSGLHAAHETTATDGTPLAIIHRDVSPQNILVGRDGRARVLDFGIAKAVGRAYQTLQNEVRGKLGYMAREQLQHGVVDRRVDVYAAGVVAWEALVGERLFRGKNERETLTKVLKGPVAPPTSRVPALPRALDEVVLRALARDREERFATAAEMADALRRAARIATAEEAAAWAERATAPILEAQRAELARTAHVHAEIG